MSDTFASHDQFTAAGKKFRIARFSALKKRGWNVDRLPYTLRVLLENLLRLEDGVNVTAEQIEALVHWNPLAQPDREIAFTPARVLLQDFTGVPAVVDLAAMRDAMLRLGGDPRKINPLLPAELVIDHSVQVDEYGTAQAFAINAHKEFERNQERYAFLRWGQTAFNNFKVVPPDTGIVHQVNLEYLARVVMVGEADRGLPWAYPDTVVGTDSHTTMINGLGVLGWGVGGIEAEAAMLGQPVTMLIPHVVGVRLEGQLPEGTTATDLVLRVTELLRKTGVVGKFVEFYGPGLSKLPLADRATIANMAPEYGATCGFFPVDAVAIEFMKFTGRSAEQAEITEAYLKEQGLFWTPSAPEPEFSDTLSLDLGTIEASLAGPRRPQDRVELGRVKATFAEALPSLQQSKAPTGLPIAEPHGAGFATELAGEKFDLQDGSVVIAAITSCTNTSNPSVMLAAGLVAQKAVARGLTVKPWVKTSLAPGSKVVTEYLQRAGLLGPLESLKFHVVGYGCTTCIGNSGPLPPSIAATIRQNNLVAVSVLSGNRNFEGRVNSDVRANYLASPPLVVAYALAGRIDVNLKEEPLGTDKSGKPVYLREIWPTQREIADTVAHAVQAEMFKSTYSDVFAGDERWQSLSVPKGATFAWDEDSTYVKHPPYFIDMPREPGAVSEIVKARVLAVLGDSITTDHISPAGEIKAKSPAGRYLQEKGVPPEAFNSYGARRGNHEVMMRGTFANLRLRNKLVPGVEGGETVYLPTGEPTSIYDASMRYQSEKIPLVILAGKEYGSGSSRDWAAKGPALLGVRAVIAQSFERIHRSNLVGMGVLPLEFPAGESAESLGLNGHEVFDIAGLSEGIRTGFASGRKLTVKAARAGAAPIQFSATVRIDTPGEIDYYRHGGILHYVLRQLVKE